MSTVVTEVATNLGMGCLYEACSPGERLCIDFNGKNGN